VQTRWNPAPSLDRPSCHPSSVSNREKKERWFAEATAITDALIKDAGGRYLCPLCLEWFTSLEDVSLEHAPPRSVGGREVALTCKACNNTAGHTIDAQLREVETLREFGQRRMTDPMPVKTTYVVDGVTIEQNGVALFDDKGLSLGGIPKQNHPEVAPALTRAFDAAVATNSTDWKFTLTFSTPDMRAASIAWLRAGYLAAFSALGYHYILRDELEPVREQINDPNTTILERYCLMTSTGPDEREIMFVSKPAEYVGVVAFTNDCAIFLPSETSSGTYERLATLPWPPPGQATFAGATMPWPTRPSYAMDRAALARRTGD
jgi:HNH endonuclease